MLGGAREPPIVLPVEISLVPDHVHSVSGACVALQRLVEVCVLLDNQRMQASCVMQSNLTSLFAHAYTL